MERVRLAAVTALVALGFVATACGSGGGGTVSGEVGGDATRAAAPVAGPVVGQAAALPALQQRVIKRALLDLEVGSGTFEDALDRASVTAGRYGGYVETSSTRGVRVKSGRLVIRVPAINFERAVHALRALGQVQHQTVTGRDVTSRFVDLQARLRNLKTQESVLRRLLANAPTVTATLRVQRVLSDVQLGIEELTGQIDALSEQVDLSTIRLDLFEPGAAPLQAEGVEKPKLRLAFDTAIAAFLGVIYGLVVAIGVLIPLSILAVACLPVYRAVRNRWRARAA
jgi:uncharacterized protein DUF4349